MGNPSSWKKKKIGKKKGFTSAYFIIKIDAVLKGNLIKFIYSNNYDYIIITCEILSTM